MSNTQSRSFYEALDSRNAEIRLLKLRPSTDPTLPLEASIFKVSLKTCPVISYRALSYVWDYGRREPGEAPPTILIEGSPEPELIGINLARALRTLRPPDEEMVIWIDAICINQGNTSEKSQQVQLMGTVYKNASEVVAWLGPEANHSSLGMDLIRSWACSQELDEAGWFEDTNTNHQPDYNDAPNLLKRAIPLAFEPQALEGLSEINSRP